MTKEELGKEIYKSSHLTGEFLLRSGKISNEYFDKYRFESQPYLLNEIARQMQELLPEDYDLIAGLEMGGIPLASTLSIWTGKHTVFVRKKAKEHGTCKFAEGAEIDGKHVVIIEDVVTSGGQIIFSSKDLRTDGAIIKYALSVIDRESGGRESLAQDGIELRSLFTMSELKRMVE
jgi:orotate phosphoribosyltransferase